MSVHNKKISITLIMNIKADKMRLVISNTNLKRFKWAEMMDHMLRNIMNQRTISQLLTNTLLLANTKAKYQWVCRRKVSNWEKIFRLNFQEATILMLNKLLRTLSITRHIVQCIKRVKSNIKLNMILKYWLIYKDLKEFIDLKNDWLICI